MNKDELYFIIIGSIFGGIILINIIRCYLCNSKIIIVEQQPSPQIKNGFNTIPKEWDI